MSLKIKKKLVKSIAKKLQNNPNITHYFHNSVNKNSRFIKEALTKNISELIEAENQTGEISISTNEVFRQLKFEQDNIPFPPPEKPKFTFIDLFAGIGGFRLAMQNLEGKCIFTSEWDKSAQQTYLINFGDFPYGDITKPEIKKKIPDKFDILCAGFPCQAFSIAGYRKGFSDTRGTLFFEIEQIIEKHRPKVVFLENVKNLKSHDGGKTFKVMSEILTEKLGYKVKSEVLNSMTHANVPQNRERIFIVAFDPKQVQRYDEFDFPKPVKLTKSIHHIIEPDKKDDKYYYHNSHQYYSILKKMMTKNTIYQWRRMYLRENKNKVCPTLTANMGGGGHNVPLIMDDYGYRKLTPRECFSFQGFPKKYKFPAYTSDNKLYMQAGNSVTCTLVERIGEEIIKVL